MQDKNPVVFCGANPELKLYQPASRQAVAVASYWRCDYSHYGEGNVLVLWVDPDRSGLGTQALHGIYTDNAPLARFLTDTFVQHFDEFQTRNFPTLTPVQAEFTKDSDSRQYYRVVCNIPEVAVELMWRDMLTPRPSSFPNMLGGPAGDTRYDVSNVIYACTTASITINGQVVIGEVQIRTDEEPLPTSAFLAFCETWCQRVEAE